MTSSNVLNNFDQLVINERGDCFIDNINNDCLISIFEYLTLEEKIDIELVCKRWNQVAKLSWNHVNSIDFKDFISDNLFEANKKEKMKNIFFVENVLKRCSSYLHKITMYSDDLKNFEFNEVVEDLSKYCLNVNNLSIHDGYYTFFKYDKLEKLFSIFVNLTTLNLNKIHLAGVFFFLKTDNIKELSLIECRFPEGNNINVYNIISNIKNLNKFVISHDLESEINKVVESLIASKYENLTEFTIIVKNLEPLFFHGGTSSRTWTPIENSSIESLPMMLSMQKKLCKLELNRVLVNAEIFNSLKSEHLTDLTLDFRNVKPGILNFHNFGNVIKFTGHFDELTNEVFEAISNCLKLKHLVIYSEISIICVGSFDYLSKLENLEYFEINNLDYDKDYVDFDDVLQGLWQCKNLKYLTLENCSYTNLSLKNLGSNSNLINFTTTCTDRYNFNNDTTNEEFYEFFKKTPYLRKFKVFYCSKVTKKLIEDVALLKKNRNDKHQLEMYFDKCDGLKYEDFTNLLPLINVRN